MPHEPNAPPQPEQRPGETIAEYSRWNNAALRRNWHYTYPRAADNLRHAKKTVEEVIRLAKALPPA